jgi:hypothetical protein
MRRRKLTWLALVALAKQVREAPTRRSAVARQNLMASQEQQTKPQNPNGKFPRTLLISLSMSDSNCWANRKRKKVEE